MKGCKKRIKLRICDDTRCVETNAALHPRGCMRATRTHIDIPAIHPLLTDIARNRGIHLSYTYHNNCIEVYVLSTTLRICGAPRPSSPKILLRMLKPGVVYLGL